MSAPPVDLARLMRRLRELERRSVGGGDRAEIGALFEPMHEREPYAGITVTRDIAYGS